MARNKSEICTGLAAGAPVGIVIPWELIIPVIFNLPCFRPKTSEERRFWVEQKPKRSAREAAAVIRDKSPGISHREALVQGRKAVDEYLASSDDDVAVCLAAGA